MKTNQSNTARWAIVAAFAMAMAWVESAVVFYLRSMMHRIEPYQPDPFPVLGGFASVELPREFATLVMLFTVGALAGRTWRARLGYTAIAFGPRPSSLVSRLFCGLIPRLGRVWQQFGF